MPMRIIALFLLVLCSCSSDPIHNANGRFSARELSDKVQGIPVTSLYRAQDNRSERPQFLNVEILPGMGSQIYQIKVYIPGRGIAPLLASPSVDSVVSKLESKENEKGNESRKVGAMFLIPFSEGLDGFEGRSGLFFNRKMDQTSLNATSEGAFSQSTVAISNFKPAWPSKLQVGISTSLKSDVLSTTVVAKNIGTENMPVSLGWCPNFNLSAFDLRQLRLKIPASSIWKSGHSVGIKDGDYDFSQKKGLDLGEDPIQVDLLDPIRDRAGTTLIELIDPITQILVKMRVISAETQTIRVNYRPKEKLLAVCPQFQLPLAKARLKSNNGLRILRPSDLVTFTVELEVASYHGS